MRDGSRSAKSSGSGSPVIAISAPFSFASVSTSDSVQGGDHSSVSSGAWMIRDLRMCGSA